MASENAPTAIDSPLVTTISTAPVSISSQPRGTSVEPIVVDLQPKRLSVSSIVANDSRTRRSEELPPSKRARDERPVSPGPNSPTQFTREYPPAKVARLGVSARLSPALQLPGAAAIEEERRHREEGERRNPLGVSLNPNHRVSSDLGFGGTLAVSRPHDAPSPAAMEEIALATEATKALSGPVAIPKPNVSDARANVSPPPSASSAAGAADGHAVTNSPGLMDVDLRSDRSENASQRPDAQIEEKTATSLSYPGHMVSGTITPTPVPAPSPGPSSLPPNGEHASPSTKRHKCPYCDTEFTRHHNLKSHLLTHSQEKPFTCQDCKLRFRRLHDLKRHGKLHTGEKNHECTKCGRKFARGDALARHSKGNGGCAGRRSSMGGCGDQSDNDGGRNEDDDSDMAGVVYESTGDTDLAENDRRRLSLPAIKAHHVAGVTETVGPNSRSYPPAGPRLGAPAVLYPPNMDRSSNAAAPVAGRVNSITGGYFPNPNPFGRQHFSLHEIPASTSHSHENSSSQNQGITESPKPLSPAVHDSARQRSPGLNSQHLAQQQYTRRPSDRELLPMPTLPPPHAQPPPSAAAMAPAQSRVSSGPISHANSGESSANLFAQGDQGVWTYIQQLEDRVRDLSERLAHFENVSNAREARLVTVESTLNQRDAKIGFLELEVARLRKDFADSRHHLEAP